MVRVGADVGDLNAGLDSAGEKLGDFGSKATSAGDAWGQASGKFYDAVPELKELGEATDRATESLSHMVEGLIQLAEALVVTEALKEFGEEALTTYANIQKATISLTALTGSSEGAKEAIEGLKAIAISDALSFPQLVQAYQRMTAFGFASDQIPGVLKAAANAAAATDKSFEEVSNAIDRMALSGTTSSRQLATLGISLGDLAKALGVTTADAAAAFKALDTGDRLTALSAALQKYGDVAAAVAGSIAGQWQNLKSKTEFVFESVGQALAPVASKLMQLLSNDVLPFLQSLVDAFQRLPEPVQDFAIGLGFLAAAVPTVSLALSGLQKVLGAFQVINVTGWAASLLAMIPKIVTAVQNDLVSSLSAGETAILRLGQAGVLAGAALAGWELGSWLYKNIPLLKQFGDAIGDFILKIPGLKAGIDSLNGVGQAEDNLLKATTALNDKLALFGNEVVRRAGESLEAFSARVRQAAAEQSAATTYTVGLTQAQKDLAKALADAEAMWGQQQKTLAQAKLNLQAVNIAFGEGKASAGQLQAAQEALDNAFKAINPSYITAKEYQELLKKSAESLASAEVVLVAAYAKIAPQLVDVETAEAGVQSARDNLKAQTALLIGAEMQLVAARNSGQAGASGLQAAEDGEQQAKKRVEQASRDLASAEKILTDSKKEEKTVGDALAAAENDFANTINALHLPALRSYAEGMKDVQSKKQALIAADSAEQAAFLALNAQYKTGANDAAALKDAEDKLTATRLSVKIATDGLKQSEKDLADSQAVLKAATTELLSGQQALDALYKDHLTGSTNDLQHAVNDLAAARLKEKQAADDLRGTEVALQTIQQSSTATDQDLKKATDDARVARENLKTATTGAAAAEGTIQQQFGLSKTAADVLAGSTVSLTEIFKDMGLKSAASLQALADVSQKQYALIASSGTASANQLRDAQIKALQDQKAAYIANGTDLTSVQQGTLDKLLNQQSAFNQSHEDQWHTLYLNIDGQIMGLSNKLVQDLFEGTGSFGKTALKTLEDIGAAVVNAFIAPATKAIANFIAGSIADLMGKTGFGGLSTVITDCWGKMSKGISDSITGIGELDKTIATASGDLSKLGSAAGPPGGTGSSGGTGGGTGGAGSAVGNSLSGWISAIAGVATAIEGIIGIFQNMHQETSLNAIEHNTRYSMMYLGERADGGILGVLFKIETDLAFGTITKKIEAMSNEFVSHYSTVTITSLGEISANTFWAMKKLDEINSKINKPAASSTDTSQLNALTWMQTALQNINNNLVAMVTQNEWIKTALQNINNGIVASAGWLQGISNMFSSGAAKVGGGTTGPAPAADSFTALATFVNAQFGTLYGWLGAALKPLLTQQGGQGLTIAPGMPGIPSFAGAAASGGGSAAIDFTSLQTFMSGQFTTLLAGVNGLSVPIGMVVTAAKVSDQITLAGFAQILKGQADTLAQGFLNLSGLNGLQLRIGQLGDMVSANFAALIAAVKMTVSIPSQTSAANTNGGTISNITSSNSTAQTNSPINITFHNPVIMSAKHATEILNTAVQETRRRGRAIG